jgi:hypothetical protein
MPRGLDDQQNKEALKFTQWLINAVQETEALAERWKEEL